ncbi:MAG: HAD family hydrolase [Sphaerochaetaceae bacterium]|nr:HAD family hydrolase [Sphaerochaetaceae bacterium]
MRFKGIIFDLDGTLLNTIEDIADSHNYALAKYNYKTYPVSRYKYFVGSGMDELIRRVMKEQNINEEHFFDLRAAYIEEYGKKQNSKTRPYPGIVSLLNQLTKAGYSVNILSNKPHFQTKPVVSNYFENVKFDLIYGKKPEFDIKPNPDSAWDLISKLKLKPNEILYVGDTATDILTAKNANFTSVGVLWGFRDEAELIEAGADYIVTKPSDIFQILEGDDFDFKPR